MYLHSILLSGFKTFPARTYIKFHPGITSIVGPNGSGKSNIVDAILWAMGEGRGSILRASRMEDVIFKGSSTRAALSRAEVVLNFIEDEDTVSISRVIYRDGESHFYINGKSSRLRDVQDKLREIGIESREYVVIEQGQVESLLNMSPEERMIFLEALAGVSMYKERRKEALRNLRRTEEKLEIVRMREKELEDRYQQVKKDLELLLKYRSLVLEIEKLNSSLLIKRREKYISLLDSAFKEENELRAKLQKVLKDREEFLIKGRELGERRAKLMEEIRNLEEEKTALKENLEDIRPQIFRLSQETSSLRERMENSSRRVRDLEKRREALGWKIEKLKKKIEEERRRYIDLSQKYKRARDKTKDAEQALEELRRMHIKKVSAFREKKAIIEEAKKREERRKYRLLKLQREKQELLKEISSLENQQWSVEEKPVIQKREKVQRMRQELSSISSEITLKENELRRINRTLEILSRTLEGKQIKKIKVKEEYADLAEILWEKEISAKEFHHQKNLSPGLYLLECHWPSEEFKAIAEAEVPFRDALWREDFAAALQAWKKERKPVVFPGGVIFPEGVLKIKGQEKSTLSLDIEYENLKREREGLEKQILRLKREEDSIRKALKEEEEQLREMERSLKEQRKKEELREKRLKDLSDKLKTLEVELREVNTSQEEIPQDDLSLMQEEVAKIEEEMEKRETLIKSIRKEESDLHTQLVMSNKEIVRCEEDLKRAEKDRVRFSKEIEFLQTQFVKMRSDISAKSDRLQELKEEEKSLEEKIEDIEERISILLGENQKIEEEARKVDRKLDSLKKAEDAIKEKLTEVMTSQAEIKEKIESLKREALDKVGKPLLSLELHYPSMDEEKIISLIEDKQRELDTLGDINFRAEREEREIGETLSAVRTHRQDLEEAIEKAKETARTLEKSYRESMKNAFEMVRKEYSSLFASVAEGEAILTMDEGLHITVRFKGKKIQPLSMLSGGERALASLLFYIALFRIKPAPFLVLDEVDAPLDLPNVAKLLSLIKELKKATQVIMITHNPTTARHADYVYGVSMPEDGTSRVYSVKATEIFANE